MKKRPTELVPSMAREEYLRKVIANSNLTQVQIANCAGIPTSTLATILTRGISSASLDTVIRICDTLKINLDDFVHGRLYDTTPVNIQFLTQAMNIRSTRRKLRYPKRIVARLLQSTLPDYEELELGHRMIPNAYIETLSDFFSVPPAFLRGDMPAPDWLENTIEDPTIDEDDIYNFGFAIQTLRNNHALTLEDLASALSISPAQLIKWETNIQIPSTDDISRIATFFNVYPGTLYIKADSYPLLLAEQTLLAQYASACERDKTLVNIILGIATT